MSNYIEVLILGQKYVIWFKDAIDDPKLNECSGYCDTYSKKIVVVNVEEDKMSVEELGEFQNKVIRHEITHAFLFESGLSSNSEWAENEEMVDWIAIQLPKIYSACFEAGATNSVGSGR